MKKNDYNGLIICGVCTVSWPHLPAMDVLTANRVVLSPPVAAYASDGIYRKYTPRRSAFAEPMRRDDHAVRAV